MTRTRWIIFILLCLGVLGLIVLISKKDNPANFSGNAAQIITEGPIADHVFGSKDNKVVLIAYGDYQCPGCASVHPMLRALTELYKDQVTFIFRHLPLTNIHPNALAAATAAESASLQGKYYEYHNLLYENQDAWKDAPADKRTSVFESYAKQLKLDTAKFKADLSNKDISAKINRDRSTAKTFNVTSTPTLILQGSQISQDITFDNDKLTAALDDELKKAGITPPAANTTEATSSSSQ